MISVLSVIFCHFFVISVLSVIFFCLFFVVFFVISVLSVIFFVIFLSFVLSFQFCLSFFCHCSKIFSIFFAIFEKIVPK